MSGRKPSTSLTGRKWRLSLFSTVIGLGIGGTASAQVTTKGAGPLAPPPMSTPALTAMTKPAAMPMVSARQMNSPVPTRPAVLPDKPVTTAQFVSPQPPTVPAAPPKPVTLPAPALTPPVLAPTPPAAFAVEPAKPVALPPATPKLADVPPLAITAEPVKIDTKLPAPSTADVKADDKKIALQPVPMPLPGGQDKPKVDDKKPDAGGEKLPPPRAAFPDDKARLGRMGNGPLGTTPIPTKEDLEEFRQFVEGVVDPKNTLDVIEGRARLLLLKEVPAQFQLGDPTLVSVSQLNDPKQMSILGKRIGTTVLNLWFPDPKDKKKEKILSYLVRVLPDPETKARLERIYKALEDEINKAFPNSRVRLTLVGDKLMVSGQAHDIYDATQIMRIVRANAPGGDTNRVQKPPVTTVGAGAGNPNDPTNPTGSPGQENYVLEGGPNVINNMRIPGEQQVMLRVTVAEVNRAAARSVGVNFSLNIGQNNLPVFSQLTGGLLTGGGANLPINLSNGQIPIALQALRTLNYARSLAEPNLTAMNGQTATFLAGGQFPVPVIGGFGANNLLGGGGGLQGVQFVPFGVQLAFTPTITDRDRVRLTLQATVSTRDNNAGANINGANVPGLNARTFSTTVEMREGQTLAVAGLIQNNLGADSNRVPFFGDLPYLGRLFSLDRITSGEQELVVLVTPELVHPLNQNELTPLPGSDIFEPGDLEFYLKGRLESRRSYDYRASVRTEIDRMLSYRRCEQQFITGPTGHMEGVFNRPVTAPVVGK